jgi:hypothetical protein
MVWRNTQLPSSGMKICEASSKLNITCCLLSSSLSLKMDALFLSKTGVNIYQTTWCHIPEDSTLHRYLCKNHSSKKIRLAVETLCLKDAPDNSYVY